MSDEADRALLNRHLSWMSQAYAYSGAAVDVSDANSQVLFAANYLGITQPDSWEFGDYTALVGVGGGANGSTNVRVATGNIDDVVKDYFGVEPDYDALDGMYKHRDGYVYFGVTAPAGQAAVYSAATELQPLGGGRYSVSFEMYSNGMPYQEFSDEFYGKTSNEMKAELGASDARGAGTAVICVSESDGELSLVFESYEIVAPKASPTIIATPYYTITIPAGWPEGYQGQFDYIVDEELRWAAGGPNLGIGCTTKLSVAGELFKVTCFTDNWGVQGDFVCEAVGTPGNLPGWRVVSYIETKRQGEDASGKFASMLKELVSFITLASANETEGVSSGGSSTSAQTGSEAAAPQIDTASQKESFASQYAAIRADMDSDIRMAGSTQDMKRASSEYCDRYQALMGDVLDCLYGIPSIDAAALAASQDAWQSETEARVQSAVQEYGRGSFAGLAGLAERLRACEERLDVLIGMIPV